MQLNIKSLILTLVSGACLCSLSTAAFADKSTDGNLVQYGKMHEAIGKHQDHGRVQLSDLVQKPHFYGVGALEGLKGEVTILDGKVSVTGVDSSGQIKPLSKQDGLQATMLVGAYVPTWTSHTVSENVAPDNFDQSIANAASAAGINTDKPFLFRVEGEFSDVRLHVIHGACPVHARMQKIDLPKNERPFESTMAKVRGTLVGAYAKGAVGNLTHPATSTHVHVLFINEKSGEQLTAHVEKIGLVKGATVMLPK